MFGPWQEKKKKTEQVYVWTVAREISCPQLINHDRKKQSKAMFGPWQEKKKEEKKSRLCLDRGKKNRKKQSKSMFGPWQERSVVAN